MTPTVVRNLRRGYLFELDRSARKELNQQSITAEMREQFIATGCPLSGKASAKKLVKDREWVIVDGDNEYSASKEQNSVVFCDLRKVMTQTALAKTIGMTNVVISNLERGKTRLTKDIADELVSELWLNDKQADVVMIASARDSALRAKEKFDRFIVTLICQYGDYPQVTLYLTREFG